MFKTDLNNNIIPHIWKLDNIVPIPKPNRHWGRAFFLTEQQTYQTHPRNTVKTQHYTMMALRQMAHCVLTRYKQSFSHNKHTHTNQKAATDQYSRHNHEVHRKLHQGTQSLHNIEKPHIHTTSIYNWGFSRWCLLTHKIQLSSQHNKHSHRPPCSHYKKT